MTPNALAQTHTAAFDGAGWTTADFERYLDDPKIYIAGDATCFAVFRVIGPEAEVLTLATHPNVQGRGRATAMFNTAIAALQDRGVADIFLDVADTNLAALALYTRLGFDAFSERAQYYANGSSAICMKLNLP